ncbi:MAG: DUF417 family protein [Methylibium sp.]|uniref:YkgB family protein n=1 Tax=Methylibium sp. TaxID=2067992 RepID=UPI0017CA5383|nr:DUF417 family protein [Methylibium sp.]MBA2722558.1 DUF417 family protein [Methylibium sp.]MBA3589241.1 DUF417 family protein [Methylibium sp.]
MAATIGSQAHVWTGPERRAADQAVHDAANLPLERVGAKIFRYGLALIFLWAGLLKFTAYEAKNIEPMVSNSPIWAWAYQSLGLQGLSNVIGVIEISVGLLIVTRAFWPKASAIGSIGAVITFLITLSFMLTTPGVWEPGYGFPALSALPGQFLAKDLVLLGVSIWTAGEAWRASRRLSAR